MHTGWWSEQDDYEDEDKDDCDGDVNEDGDDDCLMHIALHQDGFVKYDEKFPGQRTLVHRFVLE